MTAALRIVSWNIQWGRGSDGRVDLDRIVAHARRFADFDVLCLQEVAAGYAQLGGSDGSDQFAALAALLPAYRPLAAAATETYAPDGSRRRFGNMLFSRLPVRQVFRHLLPWPADAGVKSMQRVALEATLDTALGPLRVTTTHLEYYSPQQRAAQIGQLRQLHREAVGQARAQRPGAAVDGPFEPAPRAAAAVLAGDLNFRPDDPEHTHLFAAIDAATPAYLDAWQLTHPGQVHEATVGVHDKQVWPGPAFTFDYFGVSADLAGRVRDMRVDATSDASDHQPILLELG